MAPAIIRGESSIAKGSDPVHVDGLSGCVREALKTWEDAARNGS